MKQDDLLKIFCKAFGLYFVVQAIIDLKQLIFYGIGMQLMGTEDSATLLFIAGQIFNFIFNTIAAWILISKSEVVTSKIMRGNSGTVDLSVSKADLIELVIIAISFLLIIHSIPEILFKGLSYVPLSRLDKNHYWTDRNQAEIFFSIFKFIIGLVTIVNSRLISRRLVKSGDKSDEIERANEAAAGR